MLNKIIRAGIYLGKSMRLMIGVPEYDVYVAHMKEAHPDKAIMSYPQFFRERQEARFGGNGKLSRCC